MASSHPPVEAVTSTNSQQASLPPWGNSLQQMARRLCLPLATLFCFFIIWVLAQLQNQSAYFVAIFANFLFGQDFQSMTPLLVASLAAAVIVVHRPAWITNPMDRLAHRLGSNLLVSCLILTPVVVAIALWAGFQFPLSMDEYTVWWQAHVFADGHLKASWPIAWIDRLVISVFQNYFFAINRANGEVASMYWPGYALLMSPFVKIGVPALANAIMTILTFGFAADGVRQWLSSKGDRIDAERAAGWCLLLLLASPVVWAMSASFYAMPTLLLGNTLFAWCLLPLWTQAERELSYSRLAVTGLIGGWTFCAHNPLPHVLFALPWLWVLWQRPARWRYVMGLALGYLPVMLALGFGWLWLRPVTPPVLSPDAVSAAAGVVTAAPSPLDMLMKMVSSAVHPPSEAIMAMRLAGLAKTWVWCAPGLLLWAYVGLRRTQRGDFDRLWALSVITTLVGYCFIPYDQGHGWGYRYLHPVLLGLVIASLPLLRDATYKPWLAASVVLGCVLMTPIKLEQMHSFMAGHLEQRPARVDYSVPSVVFLNTGTGYYKVDMIQNQPNLKAPILWLISRGHKNDEAWIAANLPGAQRLWLDEQIGESQWRKP